MAIILERNETLNVCKIRSGDFVWELTGPSRYEAQDHATGAIYRYSALSGKTVEVTDFGVGLADAHISAIEAMDAIGSDI